VDTLSFKFLVAAFFVVCIACSTTIRLESDAFPLPEGWSRTQAREGYVARETPHSFTVDLPPGWQVGEGWRLPDVSVGWIAGPKPDHGVENAPVMRFYVDSPPRHTLIELASDDRQKVTQLTDLGLLSFIHVAKPWAIDSGPQLGGYFEQIPGAPNGVQAPSIAFEGDSRGFDQELVSLVLASIRYTQLESLPELPPIDTTMSKDWKRIKARQDRSSFSIKLPPKWDAIEERGIDSMVGRFTGDGIVIYYDYGSYGGPGYEPYYSARKGEYNSHRIWEVEQGELIFNFARSNGTSDNESAGVLVHLAPEHIRDAGTVGIYASGLTQDQQDIVLAIFRSIEIE
jgi:hypothetical protein